MPLFKSTLDNREVIRELVRQTLAMHAFSPDLHRELTALAYTDPDFAAMARQEEHEVVQLITQLLEPRRNVLRVRDLVAAAWVIGQSVETVIHSIKVFGAPIEQERLTDTLADMIYRLLFMDRETG